MDLRFRPRTQPTPARFPQSELDEVAMHSLEQATGDVHCGKEDPVVGGVVTMGVVPTSHLRIKIPSGVLACRILRSRLAFWDLLVGGSARFRS